MTLTVFVLCSQGRVPLVRAVSMEQRWQDLAQLLTGPPSSMPPPPAPLSHSQAEEHFQSLLPPQPSSFPHASAAYPPHPPHPDPRNVLLHNATLAPPMGDLNATAAYSGLSALGNSSHLGSAVATSMNLTNSSEPMGPSEQSQQAYKMEAAHDMMYYQNGSSGGESLNQTADGFLSSILNDEDLQLMDMAMNEGGDMGIDKILSCRDSGHWVGCNIFAASRGTGTRQFGLDRATDYITMFAPFHYAVYPRPSGPWDCSAPAGMYTMRLLEGSAAAGAGAAAAAAAGLAGMPPGDGDGSSDSAVSSMGSERGGAWGLDPHNATSPTDPTSPYLEYGPQHGAKYRPYDYSSGAYSRQQPSSVAQKKHHMFGKRFFQEQSNATALPSQSGIGATAAAPSAKMEMKFSCSLEFARHHAASAASVAEARVEHVAHNHSYHLPSLPESAGASHRPLARDKSKQGRRGGGASSVSSNEEESHFSRDEKRAHAMNVPITVDDIINLPMDEFNERLSKYDLTEAQLSLIRDIRRRGKNKVAAQNCRKRKLDQILSLADEVKLMRDRKNRLLRDKESMLAERLRLKEKFGQLYRHVFQALRDPEGRPYSPYEYSLQQSADGSVLLVPRGTPTGLHPPEEPPKPPGPSSSNSHPHQHHQRRS
ncbi:hypothetical protein B566_EDAN004519 [Ephemera danica]|nr:hypothetical protein B566_EDAN004519 [Ephemera danica]